MQLGGENLNPVRCSETVVLSEIKVYYLTFSRARETMTHALNSEEVQNQLTGLLKRFTRLHF